MRLASRVEAERVVLVWIELRLDLLPRCTLEPGHARESGADPCDDRESRDRDGWRYQDQSRGSRQRIGRVALIKSVVDRERRAVRVADHVDGVTLANLAAQVDHGEPHRGAHVFDAEVDQSARRSAVTWQPQTD